MSKSITVEVSVSALKSIGVLAAVSALVVAGACTAQGMLQDYAADKVIQKFQAASCEQLKAQKTEPPSEKEKAAIAFYATTTRRGRFSSTRLLRRFSTRCLSAA